jgi:small subunit ribosomal protein S9
MPDEMKTEIVQEIQSKTESKVDSKKIALKEGGKYFYGVGRRKNATARAKYIPSSETIKVSINSKPLDEYFASYFADTIKIALNSISLSAGSIDLFIKGGGTMGQAEAARLAIAKAVLKADEGYKPVLRLHGLLTTDNRKVLPKRAGLRKSRKREQWSKR